MKLLTGLNLNILSESDDISLDDIINKLSNIMLFIIMIGLTTWMIGFIILCILLFLSGYFE